ncbi:phosphatase PAP2 family protein [Nocardioides ungokensis]|uniref:phosphatase PAP2 family protein n=1 Tax=Nocardioides ungokensis TaxID=1643322 RepID=UPI0015DFCC45|nr:phosphatase PAP2 family protein [Nocardioides ungokensis]
MTSSPSLASRPAAEDSADADLHHVRWVVGIWVVVAAFGVVTALWSQHVGVPMRDPGGSMFRGRLVGAATTLVVLAVVQALWCARGSVPGALRFLRERWRWQRLVLVLTGVLAYYLVYVCYRNLKSWDAFNTIRDDLLLRVDRWIFLGHDPAVLLHDLLGYGVPASVLEVVYRAFSYVVSLALVASLVFVPRIREAYVYVASGMWAWILGVGTYYLIPTLGPFAAEPDVFKGLPDSTITSTQVSYLAERAHMLADPSAPGAFVSISAFASLHVGLTCMIWLMMRYYGLRRSSRVMAVYLALVMVSTVYFGWHFFVDVVAGVLLAVLAVLLGRFTVYPTESPTVVLRPSGGLAPRD